jgi:hypothetical protein
MKGSGCKVALFPYESYFYRHIISDPVGARVRTSPLVREFSHSFLVLSEPARRNKREPNRALLNNSLRIKA